MLLPIMALGLACAFAEVAFVLVGPFMRARHAIDIPDELRRHAAPTPRGGGVGIGLGLSAGLGVLLLGPSDSKSILLVFGAIIAYAALGLLDDINNLPWTVRIAAQIGFAIIFTAIAVGTGRAPLWLAVPLVLTAVFYVNAANFMDGANGVSATHGVIAAGFFAGLAQLNGHASVRNIAALVAVMFLSFLPWNAPHARIFIGDCGAYALGAAVWVLALLAVWTGTPIPTAIAPTIIYTADVGFTLINRLRHHVPLVGRYRDYGFAQIADALTHTTATVLVSSFTIICCGIGFLVPYAQRSPWLALPGYLVCAVIYLVIPRFLPNRQPLYPAITPPADHEQDGSDANRRHQPDVRP